MTSSAARSGRGRLSTGRRSSLKQLGSRVFGRLGLEVQPTYHSLSAHRSRILAAQGVGRVIDVGANVGQYAETLRGSGYAHEIVSFEANPVPAARLREKAAGDHRWRVEAVALGAEPGTTRLHVTVDSLSTSLLRPTADASYAFMTEVAEPTAVEIRTLDSYALTTDAVPTLLKLDVQGFELEVLRGGPRTLADIVAVECELSLVELYDGQALIEDVVAHLRRTGLHPVCFPRGFTDPDTHEVIQVDGLFVRRAGRPT